MLDDPQLLIAERPDWLRILQMYSQAAELAACEDEPNRWVSRIHHVDGVADEELSDIHGELIALGWLTFQIDSQRGGLCYRLSPEGRSLVNQQPRQPLGEQHETASPPQQVNAA